MKSGKTSKNTVPGKPERGSVPWPAPPGLSRTFHPHPRITPSQPPRSVSCGLCKSLRSISSEEDAMFLFPGPLSLMLLQVALWIFLGLCHQGLLQVQDWHQELV